MLDIIRVYIYCDGIKEEEPMLQWKLYSVTLKYHQSMYTLMVSNIYIYIYIKIGDILVSSCLIELDKFWPIKATIKY